jgi:hypothetical protein
MIKQCKTPRISQSIYQEQPTQRKESGLSRLYTTTRHLGGRPPMQRHHEI